MPARHDTAATRLALKPQALVPISSAEGEGERMRVLVVDDSSTMRRIIVNTLKKLGHEDTVEAGDGKEALRAMAAAVPDMIVTDWNMPEMNGPQFVEAVRSQPALAKTPVLMVTTQAAKEDVIVALQAGVNDYLIKPFTPEALKEKIQILTRKP